MAESTQQHAGDRDTLAEDTESSSVQIILNGQPFTLSFTSTSFRQESASGVAYLTVPVQSILFAELNNGSTLTVSCISRKKGNSALVQIRGSLNAADIENAKIWVDALMRSAYAGIESRRRFKILVNPYGGKGKARSIYNAQVQPILNAAHCEVDMELTQRRGHASEIASSLELRYDAILTLSGDGLVHEVINGLGQHKDAQAAMQIPVVPIPTGSANGFCLNLLGLEDGWSVEQATLNAIKGHPMPFDICSVTQNGKRTWSFFSQCVGLMADLDLGTEHLRWMGDTRFIVGYIRGVVVNRACPIKVSMKIIEQDKIKLVEGAKAQNESSSKSGPSMPTTSTYADTITSTAGSSDPTNPEEEGWWTFDRSVSYVYAGTMPYVARDLLAFPCAVPSDGSIDLTIQELTTRGQMLNAIDGAERGAQFWIDTQRYFKVKAFRIEPLPDSTGHFSLDGEMFPFEPFQVDIHPKMMRTMSIHGKFMNGFSPVLPKQREGSKLCCI